ncbi:SHOCT domain-containing protein [Butyrivibrio fibrisolvens]|uniref:SHOCT domain-containing protein n=1 Tax=Butyrivibrio fibrisolvens TaxID=831 RepID=UPI0020C0C718|nr:SHOCT domain-containing protein [Butyrivibrio fibrisolvens]
MGLFEWIAGLGAESRVQAAIDKALPRWLYIYRFMPKGYLDALYESAFRRGISNATTADAAAEVKAINQIRQDMEHETVSNIPTMENASIAHGQLANWLTMNTRPELILRYFIIGLGPVIDKKPETKQKEILNEIAIPCKDFNTKYMKELNDYNKSMGIAADYFEKHYVSGEASGLGFGVITNSVASALLYDIMNANEIKRQLSYQHGAAANITGTFNEERAERLRSNVAELYSQFRRDINAAVDEAFVAIDGGKTAIMKEKEIAKEKNDQDRQNVSRLSEQCREQILKDIAGIGNCKASSFFKIKGYGEYSHQMVNANLNLLAKEGRIKKFKGEDGTTYFSALDNTEAIEEENTATELFERDKSRVYYVLAQNAPITLNELLTKDNIVKMLGNSRVATLLNQLKKDGLVLIEERGSDKLYLIVPEWEIVKVTLEENGKSTLSQLKSLGGRTSYLSMGQLSRAVNKLIDEGIVIKTTEERETFYSLSKNVQTNVESTSTLSVADEIKKFKELLDIGAITQEEYDKKKEQLLNQ